ncbi:MAG: ABC transporter permease [Spirochaetes bacterium]|nr:ABC transporter permease [Spirochaetota bacterium]
MLRFILTRLGYTLITLWCIITLTFLLMKVLPGDPFYDPKIKPEIKEQLMKKYGLDKPIHEQYFQYLGNIIRGDLGTSIRQPGRNVTDIIIMSFPKSFAIGWRAIVFALIFGLLFGIIAAFNHNSILDYLVIFIAIFGISVPTMVVGPLLAYQFGVNLGWLPVTVTKSSMSLLMPSITLGLGTLAYIARMMRTTTLEVLHQDYIQTAKSKGLDAISISIKHVIRNSIMPIVTVLGPLFAAIITGSIVVERIFAVAGLGEYFVSCILEMDYPMIMGITIFYAALIILSILLVDIAYGIIDPRMRVSNNKGGN